MYYICSVVKTKKNSTDKLLEEVKKVYGFPINHAKDCENLAYHISTKTSERISGSTIKRMYGFVKTTSLPNTFTLNLLAKYIGVDDYKTFLKVIKPKAIATSFQTITNNCIENIKHRSGLNFNSWIKNIEGINQLESFTQSNKTITAIVGEGGAGKSVLLAQFTELYASQKKVLFLSSAFLNKAKENQSLLEWVSNENIELLIIDEIEETAYNYTELRLFFLELIEFLIAKPKQLRVIISIRPFSWVKLAELIVKTENEKEWFNVNFETQNSLHVENIPLLNTDDVIQLLPPHFNESLLNFLRIPLFYQIYQQSENQAISNDWQLLNSFFNQKVWSTAHAFEKSLFFEKILNGTDCGKLGSTLNRKSIEELIVKYKKAHLELLTFNVLSEEKIVNKFGTFTSSYRFGHEIYFDFIILTQLIEKHNGYSQTLVEYINTSYEGERKLSLLKLAVSFALNNIEPEVATFFDLDLSEFERQTIMIHLANQIRTNTELQEKILPLFVKEQNGRKYFIERWIDEENLNGFYGATLKDYLKVINEPQDILFANSLLYYNAYLQNNDRLCKFYISEILKINYTNTHIHPFVFGRRYMSLLLENYRLHGTYSNQLKDEVKHYLGAYLKEKTTDLSVHFSGFEHNILHTEFLTNEYVFTPQILKKLQGVKKNLLHSKDYDLMLLEIFDVAYSKGKTKLTFDESAIMNLHPWYRKTVRDYIKRLNS